MTGTLTIVGYEMEIWQRTGLWSKWEARGVILVQSSGASKPYRHPLGMGYNRPALVRRARDPRKLESTLRALIEDERARRGLKVQRIPVHSIRPSA